MQLETDPLAKASNSLGDEQVAQVGRVRRFCQQGTDAEDLLKRAQG